MSTRVYVGQIPRDTRERDLERFFKGFDVRDITVKDGYGFVEFRSSREAEDAVYDLDGRTFLGTRVRVEHSRGSRDRDRRRKYGPPLRTSYRVIVDNLSSSASWQDLKDFMRKVGDVTYADIRDGEGIVEFATSDDMKRAIRKLDDEEFKGRRIRIREDSRKRSRSPSRSRSRSPRPERERSPRERSPRERSPRERSPRGDKSPRERSPRERSPRGDKSPRDKSPRGDRSPRDRSPRDRSPARADKSPRDRSPPRGDKSPQDKSPRADRSPRESVRHEDERKDDRKDED